MQFLIDHHTEILALVGALWTLVSGVVALTPSTKCSSAARSPAIRRRSSAGRSWVRG